MWRHHRLVLLSSTQKNARFLDRINTQPGIYKYPAGYCARSSEVFELFSGVDSCAWGRALHFETRQRLRAYMDFLSHRAKNNSLDQEQEPNTDIHPIHIYPLCQSCFVHFFRPSEGVLKLYPGVQNTSFLLLDFQTAPRTILTEPTNKQMHNAWVYIHHEHIAERQKSCSGWRKMVCPANTKRHHHH